MSAKSRRNDNTVLMFLRRRRRVESARYYRPRNERGGDTRRVKSLAFWARAVGHRPNLGPERNWLGRPPDAEWRLAAAAHHRGSVDRVLDPREDASEDVDERTTRSSNRDRLFEPEMPDREFQLVEQVWPVGNETTNSSLPTTEKRSDELECDSDTTAPCADEETPQLAAAPNEKRAADSTPSIPLRRTLTAGETELRAAVENVRRKENNLEEMGEWTLAGYGGRRRVSRVDGENGGATPELVHRHLPTTSVYSYSTKIDSIRRCCEKGQVRELGEYLDRRKLAVARERASELSLTPLHVAVAFGRIEVVRYLGGRFPETLHRLDRLGRTPLHYAAMRADRKFTYHTLLTLGANKRLPDYNGHSAQFYYDNPKEQYHRELSDIVRKLKSDFAKRIVDTNDWTEEADTDEEIGAGKIRPDSFWLAGVLDGRQIAMTPEQVTDGDGSERVEAANDLARVANAPATRSIDHQLRSGRPRQNFSNASVPPHEENGSTPNYDSPSDVFLPSSRDKYGRTAIHLAASKIQSRNYLPQMLRDLKANVAYRDELYRTARDIAALCRVYENVKAIDEYVVQIAANGENDKILNLLTDGYDRILETETEENILTVVEGRDHQTTLTILRTVPIFQEMRERLHAAVRRGDKIRVVEMLGEGGKDAPLMAVSKNELCRCSLHVAVLTRQADIVQYLAEKFPATLHTGDNLERTPLHYAMALEKVEEFSSILIRGGARRTAKDLKGRQPTYYFVNKDEIIRMQHEENYLIQNAENHPR